MKRSLMTMLWIGLWAGTCQAKPADWHGQWIGPAEESRPNMWICFRKQVNLDRIDRQAVAKIACDSKYWLWINGEPVVFEGQLKRGPTPTTTYYDEVLIGPYLNRGRNTIAVLVWYWGKHGFSHNSSGKAGLVFDARVSGERIATDATWKAIVHPAYETTGEPHPNYRLSEANVRFDARKDLGRWQEADYDDTSWQAAAAYGAPPVAPWNALEKRPVLQWKDSGLIDYVNVTEATDDKGNRIVIGKLPYNAHVTPYLKVTAPAGRTIDIRTDNYMGGGAPSVRAEYVTTQGTQEYESLGWMNGHDVRYTIPKDVKVLAIKYRETGYNAEFVGQFECDDPALNTLWEKSKRTLYVTMRDNYMDCPDRERAQWWGDMVNELGEAFYVFDYEKGPLLAKKGIYELARWQRADGTIYSPVPSGRPDPSVKSDKRDGTWNIELPRQMLASVGWYGFWTYYWYTGDKQTIVDVYPHVRDYVNVWKLGDDGLVIHRTGQWDWTDWGDNKDVAVLENTWVYLALKAGVAMAELTGDTGDITGYRKKMESIEAHFNDTFWRGDRYHAPGYKGKTDDRANALAVVAGLANPSYYPAIEKVLNTEYHASPYMEKYVLEALYLMGASDQAVARMKERWKNQIPSEITTLWEGWGLGSEGFGGGTYNHAWSGGPLTVLSQYGAGVAPTKPGFEQYAVLPQMGPLKAIDAVVPTPKGDIELKLANSARIFTLEMNGPHGVESIIGVPRAIGDIQTIKVNGQILWKKGQQPIYGNGVTWLNTQGPWIQFTIDTGRCRVEAIAK